MIQNIAEFLNRFSKQLAESACVSNTSQSGVLSRFCFNNEIHCEPLKERRTGEKIFSTVSDFFNKESCFMEKLCK